MCILLYYWANKMMMMMITYNINLKISISKNNLKEYFQLHLTIFFYISYICFYSSITALKCCNLAWKLLSVRVHADGQTWYRCFTLWTRIAIQSQSNLPRAHNVTSNSLLFVRYLFIKRSNMTTNGQRGSLRNVKRRTGILRGFARRQIPLETILSIVVQLVW